MTRSSSSSSLNINDDGSDRCTHQTIQQQQQKKIIICQHNIAWRQISSTLSRHWCLMKNLLILPVEIVKNMKRPDSIQNRMYFIIIIVFFYNAYSFKHHYHFGMCRSR